MLFPTKFCESGLGTLLKRTALKFCIEWSNRELLRPSGRRDMTISLFLFRLRRSRPHFFFIFGTKSTQSGLGNPSKSSAMKFCIEWSNRELLRPSRRRDMAISLFRHQIRQYHLFALKLPPKYPHILTPSPKTATQISSYPHPLT